MNILSESADELKTKVLEDKAAYRRHLARLPIPEKLRILEEMRDTTRALAGARATNRARLRAATEKAR
jgi:hypothetical protein